MSNPLEHFGIKNRMIRGDTKSYNKTWFAQQPKAYQDKVLAEEKYYNTADERYNKNVGGRKILHSGHDADLIHETPKKRVWVSRVTGEKEVEHNKGGRWTQ